MSFPFVSQLNYLLKIEKLCNYQNEVKSVPILQKSFLEFQDWLNKGFSIYMLRFIV